MKYLTMIFNFLFPIVRKAVVQTAADILTDVAYPERRRMSFAEAKAAHPSNGENRDRTHIRAVDVETTGLGETHEGNPYHDVLMVAFDISGPNMEVVKQFLYNYMPVTGEQTFKGERIYLDSYWIADDDAGDSDCMSAVFVHKGDQESARGFLRRGGLA